MPALDRVLVTGGAGFLGFHTAAKLREVGSEIALLDNFNSFYDPAVKRRNVRDLRDRGPALLYDADILDIEALRRAFSEFRPTAVVHLAAWAGVRPSLQNPALYSEVNVTGTVHVLECSRDFAVQCVIFGSSSSVYGGNTKIPFSEDDPVDSPISPYAATKRAGELLCHTYARNYSMHIACLRFFTVYGPRQRPEMAIHKFARHIWQGQEVPLFGSGASRRDYTYVDDIVSGILAALRVNPDFGIFNLGESEMIPLQAVVSALEKVLGREARIKNLPPQQGDMENTCADIRRARRVLGYDPKIPFETGIAAFGDWFLANQA